MTARMGMFRLAGEGSIVAVEGIIVAGGSNRANGNLLLLLEELLLVYRHLRVAAGIYCFYRALLLRYLKLLLE